MKCPEKSLKFGHFYCDFYYCLNFYTFKKILKLLKKVVDKRFVI